ncbi:ISAzo13 family transposase, partial [Streptomyces bambusae]|nr:ISAzo13 family transposase [Streptomyces bambusae]
LELALLAAETGLMITVCHLPPGASKWNKIEHRLFSHITMNWRGRPLTSHEVIVQSIAATTTRTGLRVHAELDTRAYPTGVQITDVEMAALPLTRHGFHGDWNYVLHPPSGPGCPSTPGVGTVRAGADTGPAVCPSADRDVSGAVARLGPDSGAGRGHPARPPAQARLP